jgi:drug/metabolite transporter (DMT)-like permease
MQRWVGPAMMAGSAIAYSLAGYFTRLIPLDAISLLFWRAIFAGLMIVALILVHHRGAAWATTRAIGWQGIVIGALGVVSSYTYLAAFRHTTVADVSIIFAVLPFVTAALAWVVLREREGWRVIVSSLVALLGVGIMTGGAIRAGHLLGDLLAFAMTASFAVMLILLRRGRRVSMLPAVALQCFLSALVAAPFAHITPLASVPLLHLALFGFCQYGLGLVLLTFGMRHVGATAAALIGLLDTPLAPFWVWLAFSEVPPLLTLIGGGVVLVAVLWNVVGSQPDGRGPDRPARPAEAAG